MICRRSLFALLPLFGVAAVFGGSQLAAAEPELLTVKIAVHPRGLNRNGKPGVRYINLSREQSHFHVVVTNKSQQPQRLWETWNSWGYFNLRFEVADEKGKVLYTIEKSLREWSKNFASWVELAPGEQFVMDVDFARERWDLPFLKTKRRGDFTLRMRAVFENKTDGDTKEHKVWTGKIASPFEDYQVHYWR